MDTKILGFSGEKYAAKLLKGSGYKILTKNFRVHNFGEIDIIAIKNDVLVFVEVKTRVSEKYGKPEESVRPFKIKKIAKVGELFSKTHPNLPKKLRIDVVSIQIENGKVASAKIIPAI